MSAKGRRHMSAASGRELIEYRHSYHYFLAQNLPQYLPEPIYHPPPVIPKSTMSVAVSKGEVDLRAMKLDPAKWKTQDHYLLLGLQDKRHMATDAEIKSAYRRQVLLYHPDKLQQARSSSPLSDSSSAAVCDKIFKCIFHAFQILSDPEKRKLYDSVDSKAFDESIPDEKDVPPNDIDTFLAVYGPVFVANGRFSRKQPVPSIGHAFSPREDVEAFYAFWSTFESWRTFEYFDEDENDSPENRADKRWMEKKNKANRQKRKNDDNSRLRRLFEQAYKLDPRMNRFREDDRLRKEAVKAEKGMAALKLQQEKERAEKERIEREEAEKKRIMEAEESAKKEKAAADAEIKKERKAFKKFVIDNLYFVTNPKDVAQISARAILLEKLVLKTSEYRALREEVERLHQSGSDAFVWLESEYERIEKASASVPAPVTEKVTISLKVVEEEVAPWSLAETDVLINAIKTHPGGLRDRWQKITEWYNRHVSHLDKKLPTRTTDDLIKRSNEIRQSTEEGQVGGAVPSEAQTDYKSFQKKRDPRIDAAEPTVLVDDPAAGANASPAPSAVSTSAGHAATAWSKDEVLKLEQGLKQHKADDAERWDKIAALVGKTKKECMLKAKEIAQALKQKKAATS